MQCFHNAHFIRHINLLTSGNEQVGFPVNQICDIPGSSQRKRTFTFTFYFFLKKKKTQVQTSGTLKFC